MVNLNVCQLQCTTMLNICQISKVQLIKCPWKLFKPFLQHSPTCMKYVSNTRTFTEVHLNTASFVVCFQGSYKQDVSELHVFKMTTAAGLSDGGNYTLLTPSKPTGGEDAFDTEKHTLLVEHHLMGVNKTPYAIKATLTGK